MQRLFPQNVSEATNWQRLHENPTMHSCKGSSRRTSRRQRTGNVCMRIPQCTHAKALPAERLGGNELATSARESHNALMQRLFPQNVSEATNWQRLYECQGIFREHSGNIQRTIREHSGNNRRTSSLKGLREEAVAKHELKVVKPIRSVRKSNRSNAVHENEQNYSWLGD
jgi:hypothetical protein